MTKLRETTIRAGRDTQDHQRETNKAHKEIQPKDYTRNNHDINEPEQSPKNAEARRRRTDRTLGQAG